MNNIFDHIKVGNELTHFVYPPYKLPDTKGFEDGLTDCIPPKLKLLLDRTTFLKEKKESELKSVASRTKKDSLEEYFWVNLAFYEFSEYYVIQKWLNYWLQLWYVVNPDSVPLKVITHINSISEEDKQRARQNPIQNFYIGMLRPNGSRLIGLCPFHEEKTPSFNIYIETNTYHCFGCQAHGDSISFIQKTKNLSFPEAVRYLV